MNEWEAKTYGLIQTHLEATVPPLIRELLKQGGPTDYQYACMREHGRYLAEHADAIMFYQKGTTAVTMNKLVAGIAILAFWPGGIRIFGLEFDAVKIATQGQAEAVS